MRRDQRASVDPTGERGVALVAALLMMMVMSALAIALTASGRVEVAMGDNEELYAGARAAAESGLNHTSSVIIGMANAGGGLTFELSSILQGPDGTIDENTPGGQQNADNGIVTHLAGMEGAATCSGDASLQCWTVPGTTNEYSYTVRLFDDDDPAMNLVNGAPTTFSNAQLVAMGQPDGDTEDGTGVVDVNRRLVIRSTGFGPRGTRATLEQMLTPIKMPALLVDGDLLMDGNASINGSQGSVHANGNLTVDGNSNWIEKTATSTGILDPDPLPDTIVGESSSGGMPEIPVFDIRAQNYRGDADLILRANGTITLPNSTTPICTAGNNGNGCRNFLPTAAQLGWPLGTPNPTVPFGWTWDDNGPGNTSIWTQLNDSVISATYYAEASDVAIGGGSNTPLEMSIIAEGSISITGSPYLLPEPNSLLMFVTDKDLDIQGNLTQAVNVEGRVLVREQIHFTGSAQIRGQVIVKNEPHTPGTPVDENVVQGNFELFYDGLIETLAYTVSGWRETQ